METLIFIHNRLSVTTLMFLLALGIWGAWNALRAGMTPSYWGALAIGEGLILIEVVIGVVLLILGRVAAQGWLHVLYGIAAAIAIPSAFAFTRGRSTRYEALIFALVALFLAGITLRSQQTGGF